MKLWIVVDGMKQFNLFFCLCFAGAFGKHAFGSAVFYKITRSASHFTNCIWHISYTIQKIDLWNVFISKQTSSNKSNKMSKHLGTRFIGTRFIGTRFIGARILRGYNYSAPVYQSGNRVDIMTGVSVDENGYWDKTDMVALTIAYIPNNMYSGVPMFYVSNKALRNPEQKAEICTAIIQIMRGSSGKIAICTKNATLFVERGSKLNLWSVIICLIVMWWIVS